MTHLVRAGWIVCAALFGALAMTVFRVDHTGWVPGLLMVGAGVLGAASPRRALLALVALVPVAWYFASQLWNPDVAWAEALVCATLAGLALDAARRRSAAPVAVAFPALLLDALVLAALVAALRVFALKYGAGATELLLPLLTRDYFVDGRSIPALRAAMLIIEGTLLAVHGARLAAERPIALATARAATVGAALASWFTVLNLLAHADEQPAFWSALRDLGSRIRWNIHYGDVNAAGSYYAMMVLVAAALAWRADGRARAGWGACTALIAAGLWLTNSRVALLSVPVAAGAALLAPQLLKGRAGIARAGILAAAAILALVTVAAVLPQRGQQKSSLTAADVRLGMIQTGLRMIGAHPVFGIGLAQFQQRSGEFSSPELIAKFPVIAAYGENAHNNYLQIAAELGIAGGILFTWLVVGSLVTIARAALAAADRFLLLFASGVAAFALTCLGGHPLLIPEPGFVFWVLAGVAAGMGDRVVHGEPSAARSGHGTRARRIALAAALIAITATVPWRMRALMSDANLEHVGINVSPLWQTSPDDRRYREARGHATLFPPTTGFTLSVSLRADRAARLELRLDGRLANVITVLPETWTDITMPARHEPSGARFARLDLRLLDGEDTVMWLTKVRPLE